MRAHVLFLMPLLMLPACAVTSPPRAETPLTVTPPEGWAALLDATDGAVRDGWWRDFEDERLSEVVELALDRNPALAASEARVRGALALADVASADLLPSADLGASAARNRVFTGTGTPLPETSKASSFGVGLNLAWEVDLWGRIRSGAEAALADVEAAEILYRGARISLAAQTAKAYLATVEADLQLAVARANLESAEGLASQIRERFAEGLRSALDVELAESEVSTVRAEISLRERVLDASRRQLEILTGGYPEGTVATAMKLPEDPGTPPAGVPADVLSRRPDLAAAERRLAAAAARVREAEASLYPRLALTGSRGLSSDQLADLLDGDFGVWTLVANLSAPIFTGGRLKANVRAREAQEEEAVADFANAALAAFGEVEGALAADRYLAEQTEATVALVDDARAGLEISEERYFEGLTDILTVLTARRRHFTSRQELLRVRGERLATRIDLYVALGGGFTGRGDEPREEL